MEDGERSLLTVQQAWRMEDGERSLLTVQQAWRRVMLKAPPGAGHSRHVSLDELQSFIDRARSEGHVMCEGNPAEYERWTSSRNVALQDSQLYVDTPWGEKR